jgi:hypothetical protein
MVPYEIMHDDVASFCLFYSVNRNDMLKDMVLNTKFEMISKFEKRKQFSSINDVEIMGKNYCLYLFFYEALVMELHDDDEQYVIKGFLVV